MRLKTHLAMEWKKVYMLDGKCLYDWVLRKSIRRHYVLKNIRNVFFPYICSTVQGRLTGFVFLILYFYFIITKSIKTFSLYKKYFLYSFMPVFASISVEQAFLEKKRLALLEKAVAEAAGININYIWPDFESFVTFVQTHNNLGYWTEVCKQSTFEGDPKKAMQIRVKASESLENYEAFLSKLSNFCLTQGPLTWLQFTSNFISDNKLVLLSIIGFFTFFLAINQGTHTKKYLSEDDLATLSRKWFAKHDSLQRRNFYTKEYTHSDIYKLADKYIKLKKQKYLEEGRRVELITSPDLEGPFVIGCISLTVRSTWLSEQLLTEKTLQSIYWGVLDHQNLCPLLNDLLTLS